MVSNSVDLIDVCKQRQENGDKTSHVLTETWGLLSLEVYLKDPSFLAVLNVYVKVFLLPCLNCYWIFQQSNVLFHLRGIHYWALILSKQRITFTSCTFMNSAWNSITIMLYKKICAVLSSIHFIWGSQFSILNQDVILKP